MSAKRKILTIIGVMLTILTIVVVTIVALNFRDYGIKSAKEKAFITAKLVRDGLTAHMVNGIMPQRAYFLNQIGNTENVDDIWVVRGDTVIKQFGKAEYQDNVRDLIDEEVLRTGEMVEDLKETARAVKLRVTIPYIATSLGSPNCLQCHDAKKGEVLGAVSMVFNISDVRQSGMFTVLRVLGIAVFFLLAAIILTNYFVNPYLELFEKLQRSIRKAVDGDFSVRVETNLKDEAGDVARWLNNMHDQLERTIHEIDHKISILISQDASSIQKHPLLKTDEIVSELAEIYKYKKTIELDEHKIDIYKRFAYVLENKYGVSSYGIYEANTVTDSRELVFSSGEEFWSDPPANQTSDICRAFRTNSVVFSDDFPHICETCSISENPQYVCIPFTISQNVDLILSLKPQSKEEMERFRLAVPSILAYLEASKPVIESKLLMEILRESSLRDALTGLYNRKFLEEYIEKAYTQALRSKTSYAVIMLDIDYFKMVNDTYGHDFGDIVIRGLAESVNSCIRESDLAIRFGGEEFIVLLYNSDEEGMMHVAEKIRKKFESRIFELGKERIQKTVSLGCAMFPQDGDSMWRVIKFADIALYAAKHGGRNQAVRFREDMRPKDDNY